MGNSVDARIAQQQTGRTALRVLMVTPHYFPHQGGVETHTYEVARRLADSGMQPTVLTIDTSGELPAREVIEGVIVRRIMAWPKGGRLLLYSGDRTNNCNRAVGHRPQPGDQYADRTAHDVWRVAEAHPVCGHLPHGR